MCADYRSRYALAAIADPFSHLKIPLRFPNGLPNIEPRGSIRITDPGTVVRTGGGGGDGRAADHALEPAGAEGQAGVQLPLRRAKFPAAAGA